MFGNTQLWSLSTHTKTSYIHYLKSYKVKLIILISWEKTYKEFALVDVFAPSIGIFNLLAEDKRHLEEEEVALSAFPDQSLGIPNLEGLLED